MFAGSIKLVLVNKFSGLTIKGNFTKSQQYLSSLERPSSFPQITDILKTYKAASIIPDLFLHLKLTAGESG
jgi:hypothetical protein